MLTIRDPDSRDDHREYPLSCTFPCRHPLTHRKSLMSFMVRTLRCVVSPVSFRGTCIAHAANYTLSIQASSIHRLQVVNVMNKAKKDPQNSNLNIRISQRLRKQIRQAAKQTGYANESAWIRQALESKASRDLKQ